MMQVNGIPIRQTVTFRFQSRDCFLQLGGAHEKVEIDHVPGARIRGCRLGEECGTFERDTIDVAAGQDLDAVA